MTIQDQFYSATDIARPLIDEDVPAKKQYEFLDWLQRWEWMFLPPEWNSGDNGFRTMLLAIQNAIAYLVDRDSFDAEREAVEEEGGTLPSLASDNAVWRFLKILRLQIVLGEFLERPGPAQKRLKCNTILTRCGVRRRTAAFCRDFAVAAAYYHIGLHRAGEKDITFSIADFSLADNLFLVRL